jgi:hypothetical protein
MDAPPQESKAASTQGNKIIVAAVPPAVVLLALVFRGLAPYIIEVMPPCRLYATFGLMCPGCGGTRSVQALVQGDILTSLRLNPLVGFAALLGASFYAERVAALFGRKIHLIPRSMVFLWVTMGMFAVFYVARHFMPFFAL